MEAPSGFAVGDCCRTEGSKIPGDAEGAGIPGHQGKYQE